MLTTLATHTGCPGHFAGSSIPRLTPGVITPSRKGGDSGAWMPVTKSLRQALIGPRAIPGLSLHLPLLDASRPVWLHRNF
jgi:hypothetical protein